MSAALSIYIYICSAGCHHLILKNTQILVLFSYCYYPIILSYCNCNIYESFYCNLFRMCKHLQTINAEQATNQFHRQRLLQHSHIPKTQRIKLNTWLPRGASSSSQHRCKNAFPWTPQSPFFTVSTEGPRTGITQRCIPDQEFDAFLFHIISLECCASAEGPKPELMDSRKFERGMMGYRRCWGARRIRRPPLMTLHLAA